MTALLIAHFVAAAAAPALTRVMGRRAFLLLALVPAAAFAWLLAQTPSIKAGQSLTAYVPWVPSLEMSFDLRVGDLFPFGARELILVGIGPLPGAQPRFNDLGGNQRYQRR